MLVPLGDPAGELFSLAEVKRYLRVEHNEDDALLETLIVVARESVEQHTGRALVQASYRYHSLLRGPWRLPLWPAEVTAVSYRLSADRVVAPSFEFDAAHGLLAGLPFDAADVAIEFTTNPEFVPGPLRHAVTLRVQAEYEAAPEQKAIIAEAADRLCETYRLNQGV